MEHEGIGQGKSQTMGVRQLLGQGQCLVAALESLVRIAQSPQSPRHIAPAGHSRIIPAVEERVGAVLRRIVQGQPLLQVLAGGTNSPNGTKVCHWALWASRRQRRVVSTLSEGEQLVGEFTRGF